MDVPAAIRRRRLECLLDLAQAYRGWSRRELARALGRDPGKLVPASGLPKLDLIAGLADVLDWPIGEIAAVLWQGRSPSTWSVRSTASSRIEGSFDELEACSRDAQTAGRYQLAAEYAACARAVARSPDERALACTREAVAWDGVGDYLRSLRILHEGLEEEAVSPELRRVLQSNLANAYYADSSLVVARSLAADLVDYFRETPPSHYRDRATCAFAHYVRGNALRQLMNVERDRAEANGETARDDLETATRHYYRLAEAFDDESFAGIANTNRGALIEVDVGLGRRDPREAVDELAAGIDAVVDPAQCPSGDWLESFGWWCVFAGNVAVRHLRGAELERCMGLFTNKADEIADQLGNWLLRERVFALQDACARRLGEDRGEAPVLDQEDLSKLVGTMARFPRFRESGWRLLERARVLWCRDARRRRR